MKPVICKNCGQKMMFTTVEPVNLMCQRCDSCEVRFQSDTILSRNSDDGSIIEKKIKSGDAFNSKHFVRDEFGIARRCFDWLIHTPANSMEREEEVEVEAEEEDVSKPKGLLKRKKG